MVLHFGVVDREHRTSSKIGLAQSKWQQCVLNIERKSAGKNPKKVGTFIDRLKKAAHYERTKTLRVQQRTGRSRNKKKRQSLLRALTDCMRGLL
jgi:hypothetical protein